MCVCVDMLTTSYILPHTPNCTHILPPSRPHTLTPISSLSDIWGMLTSALDHTISGCLSVSPTHMLLPPPTPTPIQALTHTGRGLTPGCSTYIRRIPKMCIFPSLHSRQHHPTLSGTNSPPHGPLQPHCQLGAQRCPMIAPLCLLKTLPKYPHANQTRSQLLL